MKARLTKSLLVLVILSLLASLVPAATVSAAPPQNEGASPPNKPTGIWRDCDSPAELHHTPSVWLNQAQQSGLTGAIKVLGRQQNIVILYAAIWVAECGKWMYAVYKGASVNNLRFVTNYFPTPRDAWNGIKTSSQAAQYLMRKAQAQCTRVTRFKQALKFKGGMSLMLMYRPNCRAETWGSRNPQLRQILCPNGLAL